MARDPRHLLDDPQLAAIAPLVLAAWDDAFLTPAELLAIRGAIEQTSGPGPRSAVLHTWLDPKMPPSVRELQALREALAAPGHEREWAGDDAPTGLTGLRSLLGLRRSKRQPKPAEAPAVTPPRAASATGTQPLSAAEISTLRGLLDGPEHAIRDEVRQLLQDERFRVPRESDMAAYREQVLGFCKHLSGLSVLRGEGADDPLRSLPAFAAAFETISFFDLSVTVKFGVQFGLFAGAIQNLGTAQHHALLPAIRRAETLGCFAMTERGHGSNVRDIQTRAVYDADKHEFVISTPELSAGKEWIGGAAVHARLAVVFAQLHVAGEEHGVHALIVPIRDIGGRLLPGVRAEDCGQKMGLNGVDNGRLWFEDVRVPHSALLDRFGRVIEGGRYESPIPSPSKRFFSMLGTLVGGRVNVAGAGLSAAKVGLAIALRYASLRTQFPDSSGVEQPLLGYLSHRLRLLPGLAHAYAYSFAQHALLDRMTSKPDDLAQRRSDEALASGLKAIGTWRALDILQKCRECCGGQGYLTSNRLDALRTDADVFTTFEGDNTVLCQQVVKELMRDYMSQAESSPTRALTQRNKAKVAPRLAADKPAETALQDPAIQHQALQFRKRTLLATLAERIGRRLEQGADPQAAFEACQDHVNALSQAYVEQFVLESFQAAAAREPKLAELCSLFALSCLQTDAGWFLEHGYLTPDDARLLRNRIHGLLGEIAPRALDYVEAFGIPPHCLGPLADPAYLESSGLASAQPPKRPASKA
ncbi:MAG: acyl-CoA dehydrogenase [Polyangiales bacterium]